MCADTIRSEDSLCAHGLSDSGLHIVFRSVAVAKIMYTRVVPGTRLVNKRDEQRLDALLQILSARLLILSITL